MENSQNKSMENQQSKPMNENRGNNKFPINVHVLVVDEDASSLRVLEAMLRQCQYEVTTADSATKALTTLMENRDKFDLMITEVNMPDMDGFELIKYVVSEMDLPAIILSASSDRELVMKGVRHGACDYLLKPVRMEELKNIWQHVVRKKIGCRGRPKAVSRDNPRAATDCNAPAIVSSNNAPENVNDPSNQKKYRPSAPRKARLIWRMYLHRKFLDAIEQLGDNTTPKKIHELMNVEGLHLYSVASHLQKYRQHKTRVRAEELEHVLALRQSGMHFNSVKRMTSLDVSHDFLSNISGTGRLPSTVAPGGSFGRLNSPSAFICKGGSSGLFLPGQTRSSSTSLNSFERIQTPMPLPNQSSSLLEGVNSLELNPLQQTTLVTSSSMTQFSPINHDSAGFAVPAQFLGNTGRSIGSSISSSLFQENTQRSHNLGAYGSGLSDWRAAADPLPQLPSNSLPFENPFLNQQPTASGVLVSSSSPPKEKSLDEFPYPDTVSVLPEDNLRDIPSQDGLLCDLVAGYMPKQSWEENRQDYQNLSLPNTGNSPIYSADFTCGSFGQNSQPPDAFCCNWSDASLTDQFTGGTELSYAENFLMGAGTKQNDFESIDELMNMITEQA